MALQMFTLASLAEMDGGRIKQSFAAALDRCRLDCEDRPSIKTARSITIKVVFVPKASESGELDTIDVDSDCKFAIPPRAARTYNMEATEGGLLFNELSPDAAKQLTLDMAGGKRKPKNIVAKITTPEGDELDVASTGEIVGHRKKKRGGKAGA